MFDDLDKFLKTRKDPAAPEGLSARIIAAAQRERDVSSAQIPWLEQLWGEIESLFVLPRPAFSLALVVLALGLGLMLGGVSDDIDLLSTLTPGEVASFMVIEDNFTAGEWV